jgi:hypothetical protein
MAMLWETTASLVFPLKDHEKPRREKLDASPLFSWRRRFLAVKKGNVDAFPVRRSCLSLPGHTPGCAPRARAAHCSLPGTRTPGRHANARPIDRSHSAVVAKEHTPRHWDSATVSA